MSINCNIDTIKEFWPVQPTSFIQIIISSQNIFKTLFIEGLYFNYPVYLSKPPPRTAKPCNKYLAFVHTTDPYNTPVNVPNVSEYTHRTNAFQQHYLNTTAAA